MVLGTTGLRSLAAPRLSLTLSAYSVDSVDKGHSFGMQKSFAAAVDRVSELSGALKVLLEGEQGPVQFGPSDASNQQLITMSRPCGALRTAATRCPHQTRL